MIWRARSSSNSTAWARGAAPPALGSPGAAAAPLSCLHHPACAVHTCQGRFTPLNRAASALDMSAAATRPARTPGAAGRLMRETCEPGPSQCAIIAAGRQRAGVHPCRSCWATSALPDRGWQLSAHGSSPSQAPAPQLRSHCRGLADRAAVAAGGSAVLLVCRPRPVGRQAWHGAGRAACCRCELAAHAPADPVI